MLSRHRLAGSAVAIVLLAACAQSPTADPPAEQAQEATAGGGSEAAAEAGAALQDVYAELEGLDGEERLARLVALAAEEEGSVSLYTSTNVDESGPITEAFTEAYDIDVELYRAGSETIIQRLLQEADAAYPGADVVATNGPEMMILDREGLLLPLDTPVKDQIVEVARYDTWAGLYLNVFVAAWNTDEIVEADQPESWEDVLTGYPGQLAMELSDWDWFATLVQQHFMAQEGLGEEEAIELFREAARNATVVDGHTTMAELMAAGEFSITSSAYQHRIPRLEAEGAPVAWEPPVEPIIVRPNGIGIHRDTDSPASALLFVEYGLTEAQATLAEFERTPANPEYGGVPEEYELVTVDLEQLLDEQDKWEGLYEEVVRESGSEVIEGD